MDHIKQTVKLCDNDAVSVRMSLGLDHVYTIHDPLAVREVIIRSVCKPDRHDIV